MGLTENLPGTAATVTEDTSNQSEIILSEDSGIEENQANLIVSDTAYFQPNLGKSGDARDGTTTTRALTELGNAKRLLDAHKGRVFYVPDVKAWLIWQQGAWHWDLDAAKIKKKASNLPHQIYLEGQDKGKDSVMFARWARQSGSKKVIESAVGLLSNEPDARTRLNQIDSDGLLIGLDHARRILDLKSGATRRAEPKDFITKSLNVSKVGFSKNAVRWLEFLEQVFDGDKELIDWIQRWCGYLFTGTTEEHILVFCFGSGANGKSVFADTLRHIMGDYARAISPETLSECKRQAGAASSDIADLVGARMALSSETENGRPLAEALIKSLVAGDTISTRKMYCEPFQFTPQFKLMMLGNHKPAVKGSDEGIWRRIRLVPFEKTFPPETRDPKLAAKLRDEAPHILDWMVQGCIKWQKQGLVDIPECVKMATKEYRVEEDILAMWIEELCVVSPEIEDTIEHFYFSYSGWCEEMGVFPILTKIQLGKSLKEHGFKMRKSNGRTFYQGIRLKALSAKSANS